MEIPYSTFSGEGIWIHRYVISTGVYPSVTGCRTLRCWYVTNIWLSITILQELEHTGQEMARGSKNMRYVIYGQPIIKKLKHERVIR